MSKRIVAITGGSSGIGLAAACFFRDMGDISISLSRSAPPFDDILFIKTDITNEDEAAAAMNEIKSRFGRLDILINNAGTGISGAVEFCDIGKAKRLFDVSYFGTIICVKHACELLRLSDSPAIINISSVAAVLPVPYQSVYSSAKAALSAMTLSLRNELKHFNIRVFAVLPGDVKTGFTAARDKDIAGSQLYGSRIEKAVSQMEADEQKGMKPSVIAKLIYKKSLKNHPKPFYTAGIQYKLFLLSAKLFPARFVNWIEGKIY